MFFLTKKKKKTVFFYLESEQNNRSPTNGERLMNKILINPKTVQVFLFRDNEILVSYILIPNNSMTFLKHQTLK